ncbi:MAG: hypothetical protein A2126_01115 [Candidatus Woykebacteria bacterium GWB1_45_5]|uniref:Uncharacterized protein n=1 Tax=Candidatus Woykebacteria bacterium GWB1_45_5 TaxID=1802592 RepID=A0A1G1W504_9BACT|nr:MAG: hypothetical protein A2126_01115 [Candidatus Woykebacteria bacterium GWB1_45_5]
MTEAERNTFAGKMFNVMIQESFGVDFPSTAYNASGNWHGIFQYLPGTWSRQYSQPAVGSNIWYKPAVDSGAPNRPPDVRDGIKDGDIYNPYAQVERTVWTWNGGETGKYQVGEWGPYNIWFGSESPFVCNVYPAKCAL